MRVLICDDEIFAVESIKKIVFEYFSERNLIAEIVAETDSAKVLDDKSYFDMAVLAVEMPKHSGLEIAKHLLEINSNTIPDSNYFYSESITDLSGHKTYKVKFKLIPVFKFTLEGPKEA